MTITVSKEELEKAFSAWVADSRKRKATPAKDYYKTGSAKSHGEICSEILLMYLAKKKK